MARKSAGARDASASKASEPSEAAGEPDVVLGASKKGPQKRTGRPRDWTAAMADKFIAALADSCNVSLAARAIRRSVGNVYLHRGRDGEFRARWDQALSVGYSRLELMMLERALNGVEKAVTLRSGESRIMREYNDRVALALLRHHRDTVAAIDGGVDGDDYEEACERIIDKLGRLRERELEKSERIEIKAGADRVGLIALALKQRRCR